jgi:hypothetical protein
MDELEEDIPGVLMLVDWPCIEKNLEFYGFGPTFVKGSNLFTQIFPVL